MNAKLEPKTILLILYVASGALLCVISIPLIRRRIPPNHWYGLRLPRTLSDPEVWYEANAYAARRFFAVGVIFLIYAVVGYASALEMVDYALGSLAVVLIGLTIALMQSLRHLRKL